MRSSKPYIVLAVLLNLSFSWAQKTGINTDEPKASLDVVAIDPDNPTGEDGIIIPRVNSLPATGTTVGQLVYVVAEDKFYYWNSTEWVMMPPEGSITFEEDQSCYTFIGEGATSVSANRKRLDFSEFYAVNPTGFAVNSTNDVITVGKSGLYLLRFTGNVKKPSQNPSSDYDFSQTNVEFHVFINTTNYSTTPALRVMTSTSLERTASGSVVLSGLKQLQQGDQIRVTYTATVNGGENNIDYHQIFGPNSLSLFYLR